MIIKINNKKNLKKMKKNIQLLTIAIVASVCITVSSCKKKDTTPAVVTVAKGTIGLHLHTNVDSNEVDVLGAPYVITGGRKITITTAQLYISNIHLVNLDGSTYSIPGIVIFKKMQNEVYIIDTVPSGNYQTIKFDIGLSAASNSTAPATTDTVLYQPTMWFGNPPQTSGGFIFVNLQGTIDTTTAANGTTMVPFSYMIGTNANLRNITMPVQNFTISPNQVTYVHMIVDYYKLFNGIKLNNINNLTMNTISENGTALGTQLANNIPLMLRYEM
jgi:hypothetical protein